MPNHPDIFTAQLGALIRRRRRWNDQTQAELSSTVGVSPSSLCAWERGYSQPTLVPFLLTCLELGITLDEVLALLMAESAEPNGEEAA